MRLILGLLASLTRATFPNGPSYGMDNGGCVKVPDSRWSSHVISQWRDADDLSGEKPQRSWHAEQMKVYLDTADEANEGATKYDELSITEDTYLELVFDTNIVNSGATFNPFYPIQLGNTYTKWDGSQTNQARVQSLEKHAFLLKMAKITWLDRN